jgi:hypothetical protein
MLALVVLVMLVVAGRSSARRTAIGASRRVVGFDPICAQMSSSWVINIGVELYVYQL